MPPLPARGLASAAEADEYAPITSPPPAETLPARLVLMLTYLTALDGFRAPWKRLPIRLETPCAFDVFC